MDDESIAETLTGSKSKANEASLLDSIAQSASMIALARKGDVILSDSQLARLLDRSEATMRAKQGWEDNARGDREGGLTVAVAEEIDRGEEREMEEEGDFRDDKNMFL